MSRNLESKGDVTHGQIGRVVMMWLGSGKPKHDIYEKMVEKFSIHHSSWKSFIELLWNYSTKECLALSQEFHIALDSTYSASWWVRDYISPNSFLYLVERLLILVPHYQGSFYATKSAFVEYLVCKETDCTNPSASLVSEECSSTRSICDFIARVIQQLVVNNNDTAQWIEKSRINVRYYQPILVLRLVMIQCLLCLNSEMPFNLLFQLLGKVGAKLPRPFCEALRLRKKNNSFLDSVAKAFKVIGDPIVIIALKENELKVTCPDAILLDMKLFPCKKDIMDSLFPNIAVAKALPTSAETNVTKSCITEAPRLVLPDSTLNLDNGKEKLHMIWDLLQDLSGTLGSHYHGDLSSLIPAIKVEVENLVIILFAAVGQFTQGTSDDDEDENTLSEAINMIDELKHFSSLLDRSDPDDEHGTEIVEGLRKLDSSRPQLDAFYDVFTSTSVASAEKNGVEASSNSNGYGKAISKDSSDVNKQGNQDKGRENQGKGKAGPSKQENESGQGKGKGKKNNNKSQNKKGKGKKKGG